MKEEKEISIEELMQEQRWKNKNKAYLFELQKFIDLADNIEDENLKKEIINQVIRLDKCITKISEEIIEKAQQSHVIEKTKEGE